MKLSLSWIFDHIIGSWKDYDIPELVQKFNLTTAEIESFKKVNLDLSSFFLVRVVDIQDSKVLAFCPELSTELSLAKRDHAHNGALFMVIKEGDEFRWAEFADWHGAKDGFLPALFCKEDDVAGSWKNYMESEDYIFEIDNKSITNRPDLWGHRGVAREIAAILDLPLIDENMLLAELPVKPHEDFAAATQENPFTVSIDDPKVCSRFAGLYVSQIANRPSWIWMAYRLARVDARAIDAIVDLTNYVMLDLSEPMHAFDAEKISSKKIGPQWAKNGQKLELLDGQTIELTDEDLVISDGKNPIALAGIMGGTLTAVSKETTSLFLEAACFDATTIRKTAQRYHTRTEASTRFEKSLDPNQNVTAILRFLKLAYEEDTPLVTADFIVSLGAPAEPKLVEVTHAFIEKKIGTSIDSEFIIKTLLMLGFGVQQCTENEILSYKVTIPTFRATKDIGIPEDIVEEVARFFGYSQIPLVLPRIKLYPSENTWVYKKRMIKELAAFGIKAREVQNYAVFDESFLQKIGWQPSNAISIKNPLSENWKKLVTSLIPHILKNIETNCSEHDTLRFFEWNSIWHQKNDHVLEEKSLAGVFYSKSNGLDFYHAKELLSTLFNALSWKVDWQKKLNPEPWYHPYQTATLHYKNQLIGTAGMSNEMFLKPLFEGNAFLFELNAGALVEFAPDQMKFKPLPKFPGISLDVSMFVPLSITVAQLSNLIETSDSRIYHVSLVDFFQKDEWVDKKAITMRFLARDDQKTLSKEDIDHIYNHVLVELKKIDAIIR